MNFRLADVRRIADNFNRGPTGDQFLDDRWEQNKRPYYRLFYHLCRTLKPMLCVELGAWQGTCAAHMVSGGGGVVATIDHHTDPGDDVHERLAREAAQHYSSLFYIKGWTWDVVHEVMPLGDGIDILFIDSWHHYDKGMKDWNAYEPLLSDSALVVCDDLFDMEPTLHKMTQFWDDISWRYQRFVKDGIATYPMGFFHFVRE